MTVPEPGTYRIRWWVAAQAVPSASGITFGVWETSDLYQANTTQKYGQLGGFGVIEVASVPYQFALRNLSAGTVRLSADSTVKAALMITSVSPGFGARFVVQGFMDLEQ